MNLKNKPLPVSIAILVFQFLAIIGICAGVSTGCKAQAPSYGDFKIVETQLIYQKVFDHDSASVDVLKEFLASQPEFSNVQSGDGTVTADVTDLAVDYKKFHFTQVATPPIIQTGRFSGKMVAEIKPGKYRVTLQSLTMKGDIGYKKIPSPEGVTNYACINSGTQISRDWCKPNMLGLLGSAFSDKLVLPESPVSGEW